MSTQGLPSPPPSTSAASPVASLVGIVTGTTTLPIPRAHPLRPGSQKEISLINYMDEKILRITRRYGKKFSNTQTDADDTPGYTSLDEAIADIDPLVDVAWVSGTPSLQIPYLLSLAGFLCSYMPAFSFTPSVFRLTKKIDLAFVGLLQPATTAQPPSRPLVSMTDKVRIKSLIEETRVVAVQTATSSGHAASIADVSSNNDTDSESETDVDMLGDNYDQREDTIAIGLSRIYERTLEILGDSLT